MPSGLNGKAIAADVSGEEFENVPDWSNDLTVREAYEGGLEGPLEISEYPDVPEETHVKFTPLKKRGELLTYVDPSELEPPADMGTIEIQDGSDELPPLVRSCPEEPVGKLTIDEDESEYASACAVVEADEPVPPELTGRVVIQEGSENEPPLLNIWPTSPWEKLSMDVPVGEYNSECALGGMSEPVPPFSTGSATIQSGDKLYPLLTNTDPMYGLLE